MPVGRYAPSPSGPLHLGNLRTALLAWLFARSSDSAFFLRIEDLDPQRSRLEHEEAQLADLRAIGIDWDGEPVRQSERTALYRDAVDLLRSQDRVYPCWCTRAEIQQAAQAPHGTLPEGAYPGTCRQLTSKQRAERERSAGRPPSLRLDSRVDSVEFPDRLHGTVQGRVDDLLLQRWDGTFAYNLAVVVDDADQAIREVVRGDDLLASTPSQLVLGSLLGAPAPRYAHVPLVVGPDGRRLAKRHGAVTLADRTAAGQDAAEMLSWMASTVGLAEPGERVTATGLIERFDPDRLSREATVLGD